MSVDKFGEKWTEGFAKEAMQLGLNQEGAAELLKFAALLDKKDDPRFVKAFEAAGGRMVKDAQASNIAGSLGSALYKGVAGFLKHPIGAATTALGVPLTALAGYYGLWRPYVGKGEFERAAQRLRDAAELGLIDPHQEANALNALRRRLAEKAVSGTGARVAPMGYESAYWSPWYQ